MKWKVPTMKAIDRIGKLAQQGVHMASMAKPDDKGLATADANLGKGLAILSDILNIIPDDHEEEEMRQWKPQAQKALDIINQLVNLGLEIGHEVKPEDKGITKAQKIAPKGYNFLKKLIEAIPQRRMEQQDFVSE